MLALRFLVAVTLALAPVLRGQDLFELPWRVSEHGELEVQLLVEGNGAEKLQFGEWTAMFHGLATLGKEGENAELGELTGLGELRGDLAKRGPFALLPLLVHGDGGAAAIEEASNRLRKLGLGVTISYIALGQLKPDPLVDLLRVKHIASVDLGMTTNALHHYVRDDRRDPFVRAAAAEAYLERPDSDWLKDEALQLRAKRNGAAALQAGLTRMPDKVDLVLGLHTAALPSASSMVVASRELWVRHMSAAILAGGGNLSPAITNSTQILADMPGQLPYELARIVGNFRVDHALFALPYGATDQWWFHLGGSFQPKKFAEGLRLVGGDAAVDTHGGVLGRLLDWEVRVTTDSLEAWPKEMDVTSRGAWLAKLHGRAGPNEPPAWLLIPESSVIGAHVGAAGCSLDARLYLDPPALKCTATCPGSTRAEKLLAMWHAWRRSRSCHPDEDLPDQAGVTWRQATTLGPGYREQTKTRLFWRQCVQAVQVQHDEAILSWSLDLASYATIDLARLLGTNPMVLLRDG